MNNIVSGSKIEIEDLIKLTQSSYNLATAKFIKNKQIFQTQDENKDTRLATLKLLIQRIDVPLMSYNFMKDSLDTTLERMWPNIPLTNDAEKQAFVDDKRQTLIGNYKSSLFIHVFLEFEHFIRIIGNAINVSYDKSINKYAKKVINTLNLDNCNEKLIDLITYSRNTIHFGGFQTKEVNPIEYKGVQYNLIKGQHLDFFDDHFLHLIIKELLELIDVIINSPMVAAIAEIPHTYAGLTWEDPEE